MRKGEAKNRMIKRVKEKQTDNELKGENFVYYPKKMKLDCVF